MVSLYSELPTLASIVWNNPPVYAGPTSMAMKRNIEASPASFYCSQLGGINDGVAFLERNLVVIVVAEMMM